MLAPATRARETGDPATPRLAVVAAMPWPYPQGSQWLVEREVEALRRAGADATLFCYGRGLATSRPELPVVRIPAALSPARMRSGPSPRRPIADAALALRLLREHRRRPFDAVIAHHAGGGLAALAVRRRLRRPVVYVAHTLLGEELPSYAAAGLRPAAGILGHRIDGFLARRADACVALSPRGARALAGLGAGRVACLPPGPGAEGEVKPEPVAERLAGLGLRPGGFACYTGNLDGYQDLSLLAELARALAPRPVVVATHDARGGRRSIPATGSSHPVRVVELPDATAVRELLAGAGVAVLPRRRAAGFPMKLLNYLGAGVPVVAFEEAAGALRHRESAWLLPPAAGASELARAVARLFEDRALAARLAEGGRALLGRELSWERHARGLLDLVREESVRPPSRAGARRGGPRPGEENAPG